MLKTIAIAVVVLVAAFLAYASTRPDTFRIERTTRIKAPPEKIFAQLNDFQNWRSWSPWETKDLNVKRTYGGPAAGQGAFYEWDGNSSVGKGRMEIVESAPPNRVKIKLDFIKPVEGHNIAEFTMTPAGDTTEVSWAMYGPNNLIAKVMQTLFSMEKMVGPDFESGLARLKSVAEQ